jgi:hypothetical protein
MAKKKGKNSWKSTRDQSDVLGSREVRKQRSQKIKEI